MSLLKGHSNVINGIAFSPDGKKLISGSGDKTGRIWNARSGEFIKTLASQNASVDSLSVSPDGLTAATGGGSDQEIYLWDIKEDPKHFGLSMGKELSGDSGYLRAIESVGSLQIKTKNGKIHKTLEILKNGSILHKITLDATNGYRHESLTLTPNAVDLSYFFASGGSADGQTPGV